ncbi:MAG: AAA family ATPase [Spirochaetaceae bacterium]|nr:AAA family ATPase [Spirochaetaceae bacterium]
MTLSARLQNVLDSAFQLAKESKHEFLTPEHILFVALNLDAIQGLFLFCGVDSNYIQSMVKDFLNSKIPLAEDSEPIQTEGFQNLLERSIAHCISADKTTVELTDVIVSMFDDNRLYCSYFLQKGNLSKLQLLEVLSYTQSSAGDTPNPIDLTEHFEKDNLKPKNHSKNGVLHLYTENMIKEAKSGIYENLIGRNEELNRITEVLCRKTKNNPVIVGESGVGKTALIQGLATKITKKEVPEFLQDFKVFRLEIGTLLAGAKFRGDLEERIRQIAKELSTQNKVVLFIDEIHSIFGNSNSGNSLDANNLLKPLLTSNKIRVIGATTFDDFAKTFEKDKALCRRFQKIELKEPSSEEAVKILLGIKKSFEDFHKVEFTEEAIKAAVELSVKYMADTKLPDKAIDILDEAGAYAFIHRENNTEIVIDKKQIEKIVAKIAKVPIQAVTSNQKNKLQNLEKELNSKVFGQEKAISEIVKSIKRARAGFGGKDKPASIFLFVGSSGVGKTELAKTLASSLDFPLLRFDMSEYQEKHSVSRFIGSPPGYVGFEEGGILTKSLRKNPYSVVLFDEIEKAHQDIYNVLLQVMDYGILTDNQGKQADFRNAIIIFTSNAGSKDVDKNYIGFGKSSYGNEAMLDAVKTTFSPEFRNRLDGVIAFNGLNLELINAIVAKELKEIEKTLQEKHIELKVSKSCIEYLAKESYSEEYGARNVKRIIEEKITSVLVDEVLFGKLVDGGKANISYSEKTGLRFKYL